LLIVNFIRLFMLRHVLEHEPNVAFRKLLMLKIKNMLFNVLHSLRLAVVGWLRLLRNINSLVRREENV